MVCFSPVYIANVGEVGCGKCRACRVSRTREWAVRLLHEQTQWDKAVFLTLTYDELNRPEGLVKNHLVNYFKRLRRDGAVFKYFACGEYGDKYGRPHYHAILFGVGMRDKRLKENWPFGFIKTGSCTVDSCMYVAGYLQKKLSGLKGKLAYGDRLPPFAVMSKGLGLAWMESNQAMLVDKVGLTLNGKPMSLPRYYRKKLGDRISEDKLVNLGADRMRAEHERLEKMGIAVNDVVKRSEYKRALFQQKAQEASEISERYRRRKF